MDDKIRLIPTDERMERGNMIRAPVYDSARDVYARAYSVGMREFYDASNAGLNLAAKFDVWAHEYKGELIVKWRDREYDVARAYRNGDKIELGCTLRSERNNNGID